MTTSNLTAAERDVLQTMRLMKPRYGMCNRLATYLGVNRSWVCYVLARLVQSGHVRKIKRGVYEINDHVL